MCVDSGAGNHRAYRATRWRSVDYESLSVRLILLAAIIDSPPRRAKEDRSYLERSRGVTIRGTAVSEERYPCAYLAGISSDLICAAVVNCVAFPARER